MSDDIFRNRIAAALRDLDLPESDADIAAALDVVDVEPLTVAATQRVMSQVRSLIAKSSSATRQLAPNGVKVTIVRAIDSPRSERSQRWIVAVTLLALGVAAGMFFVASPPTNAPGDVSRAVAQLDDHVTSIVTPVESLHEQRVLRRAVIGETIKTGAQERRRVTLLDGSVLYVNEQTSVTIADARRVQLTRGEVFVEVMPVTLQKAHAERERFIVETPQRSVTALGTKFLVKAQDKQTNVVVTQGKVQVSGVPEAVTSGHELLEDLTQGVAPELKPAKRSAYVVEWVKDLMLAANASIVPASEHAGGSITVVDPSGQQMQLSLRKFHVDVHIEDGFARTTIDQTYFNHTWQQLEGTFRFPLPADASLSRLAMYVNGKLMEGGMVERDHGRNVFEEIRHTRRDPALLEWVDGSTFQMRVFPLEARQEKRLLLSYTQRLSNDYGKTVYRFPTGHNLEGVRDWSTHLVVKRGVGTQWHSPSHALAARDVDGDLVLDGSGQHVELSDDLVVELTEAPTPKIDVADSSKPRVSVFEQDGFRYLMLRHRPELKSAGKRAQRNWIFLVENSADRNEVLTRTQTEIVRTLLENAEHDDTFSIVRAATRAEAFRQRPVPCTSANIEAALKFLDEVKPLGALDLERALAECQKHVRGRDNAWIVHLGSAVPVLGERDLNVLQRRVPDSARYVGVAVGKRWSKPFMQTAASRRGGHVAQINPDENVAWRAFDLYSTLNAPRLTEIEVRDALLRSKAKSDAAPFLVWSDVLAQGQELAAVTRLAVGGRAPQRVTVTGKVDGKEWSESLDVSVTKSVDDARHLPRSWARLEIDRLVALGADEHKSQIIELSKAMYVMSPFTSLLVLENEAMYEQFNVDRGRKDHWAMYPAPEQIPVVTDQGPRHANPLADAKERLKAAQSRLAITQTNHDRSVEAKRPERDIARWGRTLKTQERDVQLIEAELKQLEQSEADLVRNVQRSVLYRRQLPMQDYTQKWMSYWAFRGSQPLNLWVDDSDYIAPLGWSNQELPWSDGRWGGGVNGRSVTDYYYKANRGMNQGLDRPVILGAVLDPGFQTFSDGVLFGSNAVMTEGRFDFNKRTFRSLNASGNVNEYYISLGDPFEVFGEPDSRNYALRGTTPLNWSRLTSSRGRFAVGRNFNGTSAVDVLSAIVEEDEVEKLQRGAITFSIPQQAEGLVRLVEDGTIEQRFGNQLLSIPNGRSRLGSSPSVTSLARYHNALPRILVMDGEEFDVDAYAAYSVLNQDRLLGLNVPMNGSGDRAVRFTRPKSYILGDEVQYFDWALTQPIGGSGYWMNRALWGGDVHPIHDLTSHAPGLQTWPADVMAVVEREAAEKVKIVRGAVDPEARKLIEKARSLGWERVQFKGNPARAKPTGTNNAEVSVLVDGAGHFVMEREVSEGLKERVICDGSTLWHLYSEIGLAAKRPFTRFHNAALQALVPWFVPSADDLSAGADLNVVGERTVRVNAPQKSSERESKASDNVIQIAVDLVFAEDGRLSDVRTVDLKDQKTISKQTISNDGTLRVFDRDEKLVIELKFQREPVAAPELKPDTRGLVVLALPYRTSEKCPVAVPVNLKTNGPDWAKISEDDASHLLATYFAEGRWSEMSALIKGRFHERVDNRVGFYVLMHALNLNESEFRYSVAHFPGDPLAMFLDQSAEAALMSPTRTITPLASASPFLKRLAAQHNATAFWANHAHVTAKNDEQLATALKETRDTIAATRSSNTPGRLLEAINSALIQKPERPLPTTARVLAEIVDDFEGRFGWWPAIREHQIRWLVVSGQVDRALKLFDEHLRALVDSGLEPNVASEVWTAMQQHYGVRSGGTCEPVATVTRAVAKDLIAAKQPILTLKLAMSLLACGDVATAGELFEQTLEGTYFNDNTGDRLTVVSRQQLLLTAIEFTRRAGALNSDWFARGEELVRIALKNVVVAKQPTLWRIAAEFSAGRKRELERLVRLDRALGLEFADLPKTVNVEVLRQQYNEHLTQLKTLVEKGDRAERATLTKLTLAAAERWRSIDPDETQVCRLVGQVLTSLGKKREAWAYWTTPLSAASESSSAWKQFAELMQSENRTREADHAWQVAFTCEPTNPELLLAHAAMLREAGETERADELLRRIVSGKWQPRFDEVRKNAQRQLKR